MSRTAVDLAGKRVGLLRVVNRDLSRDGVYWQCLCDCGRMKSVQSSHLTRKVSPTRSCGCLVSKTIDRIGMRFGRLLVVEKYGYAMNKKHKEVQWLCKCDCGKEVIVYGGNLASKNSASCGCSRKASLELAGLLYVYRAYRTNAIERGRLFTLTHRQFYKLIKKRCFYCGDFGSNSMPLAGHKERFVYGGIDRYNQAKGYTRKNSLPCCRQCNFMKGTLSANDFIEKIQAIYDRLDLKFFE